MRPTSTVGLRLALVLLVVVSGPLFLGRRDAVAEICQHGYIDDTPDSGWTLGHGQQLGIRCPEAGMVSAVDFYVGFVVIPGVIDIVIYDDAVEVRRTTVPVAAPGWYHYEIDDVLITGDAEIVLCPIGPFYAVTGEDLTAPFGGTFASNTCSSEIPIPNHDLVIFATTDLPTGVEETAATENTVVRMANPYAPMGPIEITFPQGGGAAEAVVYDVKGRQIRSLMGGSIPGGLVGVSWDGQTDAGRDAGPGVYLLQARFGSQVWLKKFVLRP